MKIYGLTGGIASGKSTVSRMILDAGVPVVDADALAREAVLPGTKGLAAVAAEFPGVLEANGTLNRPELGRRIFADPQARKRLEELLHPRIQELATVALNAIATTGVPFAIYDAALIFEAKRDSELDGVILVSCPEEVQCERLCARDGISKEVALTRIRTQMPIEEKRRRATWEIDNSGTREATAAQVAALLAKLS